MRYFQINMISLSLVLCHSAYAETVSIDDANQIQQYISDFNKNTKEMMNRIPMKKMKIEGNHVPSRFSEEEIKSLDFIYKKEQTRSEIFPKKDSNSRVKRSPIEYNDNPRNLVDFPEKFQDNIYELDRMNLSQAKLPFSPWSDSYWPTYQGSIAHRYADTKMPRSNNFKDYDNYLTKTNPAINLIKNKQTHLMSPSEKYDLLMNDKNFTLTNKILEKTRLRNANPEAWEGLCHGWAPAAYMYQRPSRSITLYNAAGTPITFKPSDIKALNTLLWSNLSYKTKFIGGRCNIKDPQTDVNGRILDKDCNDNNPGAFHLALINQVGINKRSLVFDATYDYQVWNQPISAYNITYFNPETGNVSKRIQDVMISKEKHSKDKFKKYRSSQGDSIVGVQMTMDYVLETQPSTKDSDSAANDAVTQVTYYYDLELNSQTGKIVGGEWHQKRHPDFLWTPSAGTEISSNIVPKSNLNYGNVFMYNNYWWADSPRSTLIEWLPYSISAANQLGVPLENIVRSLTAWSSSPIEGNLLPENAPQPSIPEKYKWFR
ncbi:peptidase [Iodobacter fluviatilis]|uniref:Peptidase n=1 Tax=Iodobacter fluviatilis TaxID=537 RepID=A0A7G3G5B5_9NEIS|nr:peptidase [Iodobacter fluviatilis]QBC42253.1 peptidase [Iodobacter fluviatilis]